jgi:hypothetical protein
MDQPDNIEHSEDAEETIEEMIEDVWIQPSLTAVEQAEERAVEQAEERAVESVADGETDTAPWDVMDNAPEVVLGGSGESSSTPTSASASASASTTPTPTHDMSTVEAHSGDYEMISIKNDPMYTEFKASIDIVKGFIIEHGLIVYGGTAIDYALRLKGDCIYPDDRLAIPDLDVYSPDSVNHAYMLADILYRKGYEKTRAVRAFYVRTMRVDIGDKRWVADISYVPREIFSRLPTVEYEGMKTIHPDFQRIDLHSSLSLPFDNPPTEVIFARWKKDISRFNKLDKAFPVDTSVFDTSEIRETRLPSDMTKWVFHGWAAYGILYTILSDLVKKQKADDSILKNVIKSKFEIKNGKIYFPSLCGKAEFVHFEPKEIISYKKIKSYRKYASVMGVVPIRYVCDHATTENTQIQIFSSANQLLCIGAYMLGGSRVKFSGVQFLLKYFMAGAYFGDMLDGKQHRMVYLAYYKSTLEMIRVAEQLLKDTVLTLEDEDLNKSIWFPNVYVYGSDNISDSSYAALHEIKIAIGQETERLPLPVNYYPDRGVAHPPFDYNNKFFAKNGAEIKHN